MPNPTAPAEGTTLHEAVMTAIDFQDITTLVYIINILIRESGINSDSFRVTV